MTPAPSRTADNARFGEDEVREAIARFLWDERYGHLPDASWDQAHEIADGIPDGLAASSLREMRMRADRLCAGPLALLRSDLAAARKERDEARGYANRNGNAARYWEWIHGEKDKRLARAQEEAASLRRQLQEAQKAGEAMRNALDQAEACLSIVEPRTDKAEYLRTLGVVRAALTTPIPATAEAPE